ncbi:MAG: ABC transporter ATP-binding protein [Phycisphaeraceae bacterium]|nr:ABC transporter ATP-binding protein [Phycisphaeraceae bacterium]
MSSPTPLLRIDDLAVSFRGQSGRVRAVNGVSLSIYPAQTLAVVGESGCGKSVSAMSILKLVPTPPGNYDSGRILWNPSSRSGINHESSSTLIKPDRTSASTDANSIDLLQYTDKQMQKIRGKQIAMIFQEPMTSLNPVYTIGEQILEAILLHQKVDRRQAVDIAVGSLRDVGIAAPESRLKEYPHQLSGGMRQRVMIAMALACQPRLLLADEPTTALDVTIQAQILELLRRLQRQRELAIMLITHDLGVVAENADVVAVMYAGRVVEYGSVQDVFHRPMHPYTRGLFASMPVLGRAKDRLATIPGNVPNPANLPAGCPFHPRCSDMRDDQRCSDGDPPLLEVETKHWVACWHAPGYENGQPTTPDVSYCREPSVD